MLIVLLGKTCSGKTTICEKLCKSNNYKQIITYTTRPMRKNEKQDVTYHFIKNQEFMKKIKDNFFFEYKEYKVANGDTWYYGSTLPNDLDVNDYIIILTPEGYKDLLKTNTPNLSFYIDCNNETIMERLLNRGDEVKEAKRRLEHDNQDFDKVEQIVTNIITNNNSELNEVVQQLQEEVKNAKRI